MKAFTKWKHKLRLADVFHNDKKSLVEIRDEIVRRIKASPFWDEDDVDLTDLVEELSHVMHVGRFDEVWADVYDWARLNGVWIVTRERGEA